MFSLHWSGNPRTGLGKTGAIWISEQSEASYHQGTFIAAMVLSMNHPVVDRGMCGYCGACVSVCPSKALDLVDLFVERDESLCTGCLACVQVCPLGAMKVQKPDVDDGPARVPALSLSCDVLVIGGGPA